MALFFLTFLFTEDLLDDPWRLKTQYPLIEKMGGISIPDILQTSYWLGL